MINRRGGATTSLILGIAGVIGVGVAGGMALTGTTPCSIMGSCGIKDAAPQAQTVALTGDGASCPITGTKATTVATASDSGRCSSDAAVEAAPVAQTVALATESCSTEAKAACAGTPASASVTTQDAACHTVQPAAQVAKAADSCCPSTGKAGVIAAASKPEAEIFVAPDAMRPLFTLRFTGKGMPMFVPAAMFNASACEVKDAGSCGGEAKSACTEEKKAECGTTECATATTAALR